MPLIKTNKWGRKPLFCRINTSSALIHCHQRLCYRNDTFDLGEHLDEIVLCRSIYEAYEYGEVVTILRALISGKERVLKSICNRFPVHEDTRNNSKMHVVVYPLLMWPKSSSHSSAHVTVKNFLLPSSLFFILLRVFISLVHSELRLLIDAAYHICLRAAVGSIVLFYLFSR